MKKFCSLCLAVISLTCVLASCEKMPKPQEGKFIIDGEEYWIRRADASDFGYTDPSNAPYSSFVFFSSDGNYDRLTVIVNNKYLGKKLDLSKHNHLDEKIGFQIYFYPKESDIQLFASDMPDNYVYCEKKSYVLVKRLGILKYDVQISLKDKEGHTVSLRYRDSFQRYNPYLPFGNYSY